MKTHMGKRVAIITDYASAYDSRLLKFEEMFHGLGWDVGFFAIHDLPENIPDTFIAGNISLRVFKCLAALVLVGLATLSIGLIFLGQLIPALMGGGLFILCASVALAWRKLIPETIVRLLLFRMANFWIYRKVHAFGPTCIVCTDIAVLRVSAKLKMSAPVKLIYDAHEYFRDQEPGNTARAEWVRKQEVRYGHSVDTFITVNRSIGELYDKSDANFPPPIIVHNSVRRPKAAPVYDGRLHEACGLAADRKILLYHGALSPLRGLDVLAKVAPLLPDPWVLVIMGTSDPKPWFSKEHAKLRFITAKPQNELAHWIAGASLGAILYLSLIHISEPTRPY